MFHPPVTALAVLRHVVRRHFLSEKLGAPVFLQVMSRMKRSATEWSAFRSEIAASVNGWIVQPEFASDVWTVR